MCGGKEPCGLRGENELKGMERLCGGVRASSVTDGSRGPVRGRTEESSWADG